MYRSRIVARYAAAILVKFEQKSHIVGVFDRANIVTNNTAHIFIRFGNFCHVVAVRYFSAIVIACHAAHIVVAADAAKGYSKVFQFGGAAYFAKQSLIVFGWGIDVEIFDLVILPIEYSGEWIVFCANRTPSCAAPTVFSVAHATAIQIGFQHHSGCCPIYTGSRGGRKCRRRTGRCCGGKLLRHPTQFLCGVDEYRVAVACHKRLAHNAVPRRDACKSGGEFGVFRGRKGVAQFTANYIDVFDLIFVEIVFEFRQVPTVVRHNAVDFFGFAVGFHRGIEIGHRALPVGVDCDIYFVHHRDVNHTDVVGVGSATMTIGSGASQILERKVLIAVDIGQCERKNRICTRIRRAVWRFELKLVGCTSKFVNHFQTAAFEHFLVDFYFVAERGGRQRIAGDGVGHHAVATIDCGKGQVACSGVLSFFEIEIVSGDFRRVFVVECVWQLAGAERFSVWLRLVFGVSGAAVGDFQPNLARIVARRCGECRLVGAIFTEIDTGIVAAESYFVVAAAPQRQIAYGEIVAHTCYLVAIG